MPTRLPEKPRAKSIRADHHHTAGDDVHRRAVIDVPKKRADDNADTDKIDWLALWALSLAFSAVFIAALVYFNEGDAQGAAAVLAGTAGIISIALFITDAPGERS